MHIGSLKLGNTAESYAPPGHAEEFQNKGSNRPRNQACFLSLDNRISVLE